METKPGIERFRNKPGIGGKSRMVGWLVMRLLAMVSIHRWGLFASPTYHGKARPPSTTPHNQSEMQFIICSKIEALGLVGSSLNGKGACLILINLFINYEMYFTTSSYNYVGAHL